MSLPRLLIAVALLSMSPQTPAAPPPSRQAAPAPRTAALTVPFTQFTLPNGLHVILHEDHTVPLATVNVWYHVGSAREKPGRTGLAHLFEHLMFEGSGHVKEGEFDTALEAAGATNNGSTQTDRTITTSTHRRMRSSLPCFSNPIAWATCSTRCRPNA
jgi:hypothetical protein